MCVFTLFFVYEIELMSRICYHSNNIFMKSCIWTQDLELTLIVVVMYTLIADEVMATVIWLQEMNWNTPISVHKAVVIISRQRKLPKLQASRFCNNKVCVNVDYINLESNIINNQRKTCARPNRCLGHPGYPACIGMMLLKS